MEILKERIRKDGRIKEGHIIKVDSFLNHQIDIELLDQIGREFKRLFEKENITKVITIEASGIAVACSAAHYFGVPVVFLQKNRQARILTAISTQRSSQAITRGIDSTVMLEKRFLNTDDRILIIDRYPCHRQSAIRPFGHLQAGAGATVCGIGVVIEKGFQGGGDQLREAGYNLKSLAIIDSMENKELVFRD